MKNKHLIKIHYCTVVEGDIISELTKLWVNLFDKQREEVSNLPLTHVVVQLDDTLFEYGTGGVTWGDINDFENVGDFLNESVMQQELEFYVDDLELNKRVMDLISWKPMRLQNFFIFNRDLPVCTDVFFALLGLPIRKLTPSELFCTVRRLHIYDQEQYEE